MKIGIVTMPLCANYGGTLQNWALQQVLKRMGHEPITLRFPVMYQGMTPIHYWLRVFPKQIGRFVINKFRGCKYEIPQTIGVWKRNVSGMEHFIEKHIRVTEYLPNLSIADLSRYGIDALIVGSDQIWRPVQFDAVKYYFLGFAAEYDILKVAYAPSLALDEWPYKEETTIVLRELIKKFSAVSVREESSVRLIKDNLGVDAQWVLDPTMLLKEEDYLELCKDEPYSQEPYMFAYILDMTNEKRAMAEHTASTLGCSVRYLTADKVKADDTIEKWLANFRDAKYVITDSYHGTVFSLIFQKPFYCFYNVYRGKARMDSLRKISGLDNRFLIETSSTIEASVDYLEVEKNINTMREQSLSFLKGALFQ